MGFVLKWVGIWVKWVKMGGNLGGMGENGWEFGWIWVDLGGFG
jgi:hypothetical protein